MNTHTDSMRIYAIILILFFMFFSCKSEINYRLPQDRNDLPLHINTIKESRLYVVTDPNYWSTNSVIYTPPEGILFVDGMWTDKTTHQFIMQADMLSSAEYAGMILTSYSLNRTGGVQAFMKNRIPVYLNKRTRKQIVERWNSMQKEMSLSFSSWKQLELIELNESSFTDSLELLNGKVYVFYPGPGFTEDNLVVYFKEEKVLFAGELISYPPVEIFSQFDKEALLESIKKIESLDFEIIIPGHGKPGGRELLDSFKKMIQSQ